MNFYASENFIYLWSLPALVALFLISHKIWERRLSKIGNISTLRAKLMPSYRASETVVRLITLILVLILSICALSRPQWGEEKKKVQRKGVDIIFLLDTSLSMLAEDIKPSRFEKSKMEIKNILKKLKGDRIGMVAFAGSGFLQSPLTLDTSAFLLFLDAIKVGYIPDPGTSLEKAILMALKSFPEKDNKHKALVLFTDGEDHEGGLDAALEAAKKSNLRIYTIGTGSLQGEPIPLRDQQSRQKTGFKKDRSGQVVITKLNEEILEKIARETGGLYFPSTPGEDEVDILLKHMGTLGKRDYKEKLIAEREDHYQLFLFMAIFFLISEMLIQRTRKKLKLRSGKSSLMIGLLILLLYPSQARAEDPVKLYQDKKYKSALDVYQKEKIKNPDNPAVRYNLGTTMYQVDQFHDAAQELEKTTKEIQDPALKSKAYYNYGNAQYRLGNFEKAIDSYKKALELNPADQDAKYNLEFLQKKKGAFDKKDSERKNDKNQNKNQQNQQQNQQNQQQNQQNQQQNQQNQQQNQQNQQQNQQNQQQNQQNQQQNQQNQQQNQKDQQDQQDQDQQDKQDQQNKDQKNNQKQKDKQDQSQQNQDQKDQQKQDQNEQKNQQDRKDQQDQKDKQEQPQKPEDQNGDQEKKGPQEQGENPSPKPTPSEEPSQEPTPEPQDQGESPQPQAEQQQNQQQPSEGQDKTQQPPPPGQGGGKRPLQGQMSMENAMQILEALKEGEKDLQDLRKPTNKDGQPHQPLKDW